MRVRLITLSRFFIHIIWGSAHQGLIPLKITLRFSLPYFGDTELTLYWELLPVLYLGTSKLTLSRDFQHLGAPSSVELCCRKPTGSSNVKNYVILLRDRERMLGFVNATAKEFCRLLLLALLGWAGSTAQLQVRSDFLV